VTEKEWRSRDREEDVRHPDKQQPPPDIGGCKGEQEDSDLTAADHTATARRAARERIRRLDHQHRHASACERAGMSLAVYYRSWWGVAA
jgi:hypothetical protein